MSFSKFIEESNLVFDCQNDINQVEAEGIVAEANAELDSNPQVLRVLLDMRGGQLMDSAGVKILATFANACLKKSILTVLLKPSPSLASFVLGMGAGTHLKIAETLADAEKIKPPIIKPSIDVSFINPFIEGAVNTLKVQCSFECKAMKPILKSKATDMPRIDIAGVIGVTSSSFNGSIALCFPTPVFLKIMSNMLGEPFAEITKDLEDGAGELLNIIYGQAKVVLNKNGHSIDKALPTIVKGENISVNHISKQAAIVMPFETEVGIFYIEIATDGSA